MSLLTIGSIAFDSIKTPFGKISKTLGGSASYISLSAKNFTAVSIIAVVGKNFTDKYQRILKGVNTKGIEKTSGKTFQWGGEYGFDLNSRKTLYTKLGVFADFKPKLNEHHRNTKYIFLGNIHPKLQLDVLKQIKKPKLVGLDTMNLWIKTAHKDLLNVIKQIDVLIINDEEARQLSKENNLLKSAKKILRMMNDKNSTLIIKQGEHGLLMFINNNLSLRRTTAAKQSKNKIAALPSVARNDMQIFNLPGFPLENVVDPTGAGDSFAGGFMGYLAKADNISYKSLKKACAYGTITASFCIEKFGTKALENLTDKHIQKRYKKYKQLTRFNI